MIYSKDMKIKLIPWKKIKNEMLKDPEFKKAYDDLQPEFDLIKLMIQKRIDEGLTQKELARRMKTKQSAISRFESGTYNPSLAWIRNAVHALNAKIRISITS